MARPAWELSKPYVKQEPVPELEPETEPFLDPEPEPIMEQPSPVVSQSRFRNPFHKQPEPTIDEFAAYPSEPAPATGTTFAPRLPAKPKVSGNAIKLIIFNIVSFGIFAAGIWMAINTKTAGNFEAFYTAVVSSNVMVSLGVVMMYHSVDAGVGSIREWIRNRK